MTISKHAAHGPGGASIGRRDVLAGTAALMAAAGGTGTFAAEPAAARIGAPAILRGAPDVAVIGAGAFGGWTALALREAGARVALIDAYGAGNPRASSGDESRLLRLSYGPRAIYTRWAARAQALWEQRQTQFGRRLFYPNGSLRAMSAQALAEQRATFDAMGIAYDVLSGSEVNRRWPQLDMSEYDTVLYESSGGVVKAREAMIAVSEIFQQAGGTALIGRALPVAKGGPGPITLDGNSFACGVALFACGPWLPKIFPQLMGERIITPRREIFYVGSPMGDARYRWEHVPNLADTHTYTAADVDYGTKIAARLHDVPMDPDSGDREPSAFLARQIRDYVALRFPGLRDQPIVATRVCQVEQSDNAHYIVDRHPDLPGIWIAGGGSGHAFKMGPRLGEYLASRLQGRSDDAEADALFALSAHGPIRHEH